MLSNKEIICPNNLLKIARDKGPAKAVIVNAGKKVAILSTKQAVEANLITPIFVGDKTLIKDIAKENRGKRERLKKRHAAVKNQHINIKGTGKRDVKRGAEKRELRGVEEDKYIIISLVIIYICRLHKTI